jgi:ribosomal protein S18 acetylase RimI-like enzyme
MVRHRVSDRPTCDFRPETLARSTFAYPDSTFGPEFFGVADRMGLIAEYRRNERANSDRGSAWCRDPLDHYIEAHVHGGVKVPEDVEALVIDPSFDDHTVVETAGSRGLVVETHPGYVAEIADIAARPEYRGQDVADLACRIAEALANSAQLRPIHVARAGRAWDVDGQQIKKVWHCLARFGRTW